MSSETPFFSEPERFRALAIHVFPRLVEQAGPDRPIRIWVLGCSTGEESYSIAISLLEYLEQRRASLPIKIFATDESEAAIARARLGIYPFSIEDVVSHERLLRFFTRQNGEYRISRTVRETCIFATHTVGRDAALPRIDLIVGRNMIARLEPSFQDSFLGMCYYALKPEGFLMLGAAAPFPGLQFVPYDQEYGIYVRNPRTVNPLQPSIAYTVGLSGRQAADEQPDLDVWSEASRVILDRFTPPGVVIDGDYRILQFRGRMGGLLEPPPGNARLNLIRMAPSPLLPAIREAVMEARTVLGPASRRGIHVSMGAAPVTLDVEVIPLDATSESRYLVLFPESGADGAESTAGASARPGSAADGDVLSLRRELAASREHLQSIIRALEAANQDLDVASEEMETTNEELNTVNDELNGRNNELVQENLELRSLLGMLDAAVLLVTPEGLLQRYTRSAAAGFNLTAADVGKPLSRIQSSVPMADVEALVGKVGRGEGDAGLEFQEPDGTHGALRVQLCRDVEKGMDGVVVTLLRIPQPPGGDPAVRSRIRDFLNHAVI